MSGKATTWLEATCPGRALVVGLGSSGVAAASLLASRGWSVLANDQKDACHLVKELAKLPKGVGTVLGGHPLELLGEIDLVVVSPGVPWDLPLLLAARVRGIEVIAEVELAFRAMSEVPLAGVTGSNGKTTTTALLGELLTAAGMKTGVGGNIGTPACQLVQAGPWDAWVLELSSFQLEGCSTLRPKVGLLLNLSSDHLDRHPTMAAYLAAKASIFANQTAEDIAILNADDPALGDVVTRSRKELFSLRQKAEAQLADDTLWLDSEPLLPRAELPLLGEHNVANALAAALAAARLGAPRDAIVRGLKAFQGLPHRHRLVGTARGVRFVDDSKGTNIGATAAGLAGYAPGTIHLILGGLGKGQDFAELAPAVAGRLARAYLIGTAAEEIGRALTGVVPLEHCGELSVAVEHAFAEARAGDTVLLSPACASFDQFDNYHHRGEEFARLAREIAGAA
jgi:UDP-N-acetylmuramoylalanine--D-glutamate ligase